MPRSLLRAGLIWVAGIAIAGAQELEPRRWSHVPIDSNYLSLAYAHTTGDIFFDPVLRVEDASVEAHTFVAAYLRSFDLAGQTARFDMRVPYQRARWSGLLDGAPASVEREGVGDPRFRLSVNFLGSPALKGEEFRAYRAAHGTNTIAGAALEVTVPLGQYKEEKLLNLGGNRFVIRPQAGVVHTRGPWSYEITGSAFFFTDNHDFYGGNEREQKPLYLVQAHLIRTFDHGIWGSLSGGYDWGGESRVNGEEKSDRRSDFLYAISAGTPLGRASGIKFAFARGTTRNGVGSDTNNILVAYTQKF